AIVSEPQHGALSGIDQSTHKITYTSSPDFIGDDSFTFKAIDNHQAESNVATVSIKVNPSATTTAPEVCNKDTVGCSSWATGGLGTNNTTEECTLPEPRLPPLTPTCMDNETDGCLPSTEPKKICGENDSSCTPSVPESPITRPCTVNQTTS